jgi:hypothetical protein
MSLSGVLTVFLVLLLLLVAICVGLVLFGDDPRVVAQLKKANCYDRLAQLGVLRNAAEARGAVKRQAGKELADANRTAIFQRDGLHKAIYPQLLRVAVGLAVVIAVVAICLAVHRAHQAEKRRLADLEAKRTALEKLKDKLAPSEEAKRIERWLRKTVRETGWLTLGVFVGVTIVSLLCGSYLTAAVTHGFMSALATFVLNSISRIPTQGTTFFIF